MPQISNYINCNQLIRVKLSKYGQEILLKAYKNGDYMGDLQTEITTNGYLTAALWQMMLLFGPHFAMHLDPPFEKNSFEVLVVENPGATYELQK